MSYLLKYEDQSQSYCFCPVVAITEAAQKEKASCRKKQVYHEEIDILKYIKSLDWPYYVFQCWIEIFCE